MTRIFLSLLFLLSIALNQDSDFGISPSYIASFGSVTMNNEVYNQISFTPEIPISQKIGLGLEFYLYFDENGELYGENWDFSSSSATFKTLIDKIKYFRYGQPIDDTYFRIGSYDGNSRDIHTSDFDVDEECIFTGIKVYDSIVNNYFKS